MRSFRFRLPLILSLVLMIGLVAGGGAALAQSGWTVRVHERTPEIRFSWAGRRYGIGHPGELGDFHFIRIVDGVPAPPYLELVLVRRSSWLNRTRAALRREDIEVFESGAEARE